MEATTTLRLTGSATVMKRPLLDLAAWLPPHGVERRSELVSDEWLAGELARDANPDRIVELDPGHHPLGEPQPIHKIAAAGFDPI
ncbi:hypothetical protein [Brevundimonas sp. TWP2-3-2]|uniref:hypothetical protein n=1 Tax=Brevundimonas sp. TWP2-3-2 TaxID=2804648 RepID=UPI003CED3881